VSRHQLPGGVARLAWLLIVPIAAACAGLASLDAQQPVDEGPRYEQSGRLIMPADYREWTYLTSGVGMTYGPAGQGNPPGNFDNVFVNREAYRQFMRTGRWPDKAIFILEIRSPEANVSINKGGHTQGRVVAVEAAVKDASRFPDTTWAYFDFGAPPKQAASAAALPPSASCYSCHRQNAAVEQTFVQFYPTLMDTARRLGTLNPGYIEGR
jgi:hypothetical protein